ncbi:MAG: hypothetical protein IJS14_01200 [Lentisphaeria bacterium]|nr:hypothetical protein [Lentisphaeria bacterium]
MMKVDFKRSVGKFKPMNGVSLAPTMSNIYAWERGCDLYRKLNIQAVRLHDVPLNNPGMRLVDIHQIFADFDADPADPKNYYFEQTDDYLQTCIDLGLTVEYRLGESIEHSPKRYFTHPPKDYEKWAEICCRIAEHYTRGWANGFHWGENMKYWTVWCEPNEWKLWSGTPEDYFRLYAVTARKFAERLPELQLGGPCWGCCVLDKIEAFLAYCREHDLKLDFVTWNQYDASPMSQQRQPAQVRELTEKYGYGNVGLHLGEWHYFNRRWNELKNPDTGKDVDDPVYGMNGFGAAGYTACCLAAFQDSPLTGQYFYTGGNSVFGICDRQRNPKKTAYAIEAYGKVLHCPERVWADPGDTISPELRKHGGSAAGDVRILAGRENSGEGVVMIAVYMWMDLRFELEIAGMDDFDVTVWVTDKDHNQAPVPFVRRGNILEIMKPSSSAVYEMHLIPKSGC